MSAKPTPDPPTDAALAGAYRQGSQQAATELVRRHAGALGRFLYGSGAMAADVDDLVQEAFFRAFRSLDSWRGEGSMRSWLFTIGGNLLRDEFRRAKGRKMLPLDDRDVPDHADPQGDLVAAEAEKRLREGLAALPRLQREVFLLRVQQGSAYDEIAVALGTTPGAARVHYHHAVKRLKELIR
jgi:RNA polymerase sigma-70 factor (ECF subfamily)